MNIENVKKLLKQIKDHGKEHFSMSNWYIVDDGAGGDYYLSLKEYDDVDISECGTTACMAGHTIYAMVNDTQISVEDWARCRGMNAHDEPDTIAAEWLGIRDHQPLGGECPLFYEALWDAYGDIGETAQNMSRDIGEYEAAIFLLEKLIDKQERGVPLREELTEEEISRQDRVDEEIEDLLCSLVPRVGTPHIEDIGKVRDVLTRIAKDYGYTEHEFYPYIEC